MRATIQFSQLDKKFDILQKLFSFVKGFKNLRQHILEQGILLERLNSSEIENVQRALAGINYLEARVIDNSVRIFLAHNMLELDQLVQGIGLGVYGAIARFQALDLMP